MNFQNNPSQFMSMGNWGQPSGQLPSLVSQAMPDLSGGFSPNPSGDFMSSFTSGTTPGGFEGFGGDYGNFSKPYEGGGFMEGMLGGNGKQGWGGMALGGAGALASAFMGMQQYGLAKQQLAENKRQFDTNFGAQKTLTNSNLEDRQRARVASNPGAYQSVGTYMTANGVK